MGLEIVAEIAQGFEGDKRLAELLVRGAIASDADAVKIQLVFADELAVATYPYYDLFKSLEMDRAVWQGLVAKIHAANKKVYFDVYGDKSIDWAREFGADGVKISTTDFYNTTLLKRAFSTFNTVFVSIGGVSAEELDEFMQSIARPEKVVLMHGFQAEPTETKDNNLLRISTLRQRYPNVNIGFMDHSLGSSDEALNLPILALGLGITHLEKHLSLDYLLEIEDYISALSPERFKKMVQALRAIEPALGKSEMILTEKELAYKSRAGKVVVVNKDLQAGTTLTEGDLAFKRVSVEGNTNYFKQYAQVVGGKLKGSICKDKPLERGSHL